MTASGIVGDSRQPAAPAHEGRPPDSIDDLSESSREPVGRVRANIISWDGGGLGTDIDILTQSLVRVGCEVAFKGRRHRRARSRAHSLAMTAGVLMAQRWAALTRRPMFEVNFFIESVFPEYLPTGRVNCLFVHPEWFRDENLAHLPRLDFVLCKTRSAVEAFAGLPVACRDLAFTSPDRRIPGFVGRGPMRCLHVAGQSAVKGTEAVVEAWSRHPEWPELTVVRRARRYGGVEAPALPPLPNVRYLTDYVPDEHLRKLQNVCEVHVLPSQAEGYGHVIGEAMSCGAIVVTTDAPPMNELVTSERGVLVAVERSEPMRRSMRNYVDVGDLEAKLNAIFVMPEEHRAVLGGRARAWYEAQDRRFERRLRDFLAGLRQYPRAPRREWIVESKRDRA
jgi:glycosyltransferase involved in cell wall biosynthesis